MENTQNQTKKDSFKIKNAQVCEFKIGDIFVNTCDSDSFIIVSVSFDQEVGEDKFTILSLTTNKCDTLHGCDVLSSGYNVFRDEELIACTD